MKLLMSMHRFYLFICAIMLVSCLPLLAQEDQNIGVDDFPEYLRNNLLATQNKQMLERAENLLVLFEKEWRNNESALYRQKEVVAGLYQFLTENGFRTYTHQFPFIENTINFSASGQSSESLGFWLEELKTIAKQKNLKTFDLFMSQSSDLSNDHKLGAKGTTAWYLRNGNWHFDKDTTLLITITNSDLSCATKRDSILVRNTNGRLRFMSSRFEGQGGKVDWHRFGEAQNNKYVELQTYVLDLTKPVMEADSALLYYPDYFASPVIGNFKDQVFHSPPSDQTPFPKFETYLRDFEIADFFENIDFIGGLRLEGVNIVGVGSALQLAALVVRTTQQISATIRSEAFVFSSSRVQSDQASVAFHLDQDSIYHAGLWMRYDHEKELFTFNRSEKGIGDAPFIDSYHQVNIFVEAVYWSIDSKTIAFRQMEGLGSESIALIESSRLFSAEVFGRLQAMDDRNPIFVIADYIRQYQTNGVLQLGFLSDFMKKPEEQVVAQLLRLAARGFLSYDPATQTAYVNERFYHIVEAGTGKSDFDVITITSVTGRREPNLLLDLNTNDLIIYGVDEVVLSETQGVQLFPENRSIVMKRNRDFAFNGLVRAGLFDFHAKEAVFEYDPFKLNFAFVDSLTFVVPERGQDLAKQIPSYVKVRNVLSDLNGTLYIDDPTNKSGAKNLHRYPIFSSKSESYVYFDKPDIQQGTLNRDAFFYVVDPFEIDSLDNFSTDNLRFEGYLTSAEIFPVFREPLTVMKDYSLGFDHELPDEGYAMFNGLGHFNQNISLSNAGFTGMGALHYITSVAYAKDFVFYPDSVTAMAELFELNEQIVSPEFPKGKGEHMNLHWDVMDSLYTVSTTNKDFEMYALNAFNGTLQLRPSGMIGAGNLSFDLAKVQSSWFNFLSQSFGADTADFRLFPTEGSKEAFMANDYKTFVDYRERQASFSHLDETSKLSFPYNQYYCTLDEAVWLMDEQRIVLNNNKVENRFDFSKLQLADIIDIDLNGSEFVSEHPEQDSLSFFCLEANYDLNNYAIVAQDVKIIRVADAAIFPNDGIITILGDAVMKPLESATIITNVETKIHHIYDARVSVYSSTNYVASGSYTYKDINGQKFILRMPEITVSAEGTTKARALIEETDEFFLNPWFAFAGEAFLDASNPLLRFNGGFKIMHICLEQPKPWVLFDTVIDPLNVMIPINESMRDIQGGRINSGLYYATVDDSYYAAFLQEPKGSDKAAAFVGGVLVYDRESASYQILEKQANGKKPVLTFNTSRCVVEGKAPIDLGLRLGHMQLETYGSFIYKMIPDSLYLNVFAKLQFPFDEKLLEQMADSVVAANLPGAALNTGNYLGAIQKFAGNQEAEKLGNEIALYGSPRKVPDILQQSIVFSDLKLKWNPETRSFVSIGPFGLSNILKTNSSKLTDGFVEIEKSRAADGFSMYIMLNAKQWFFFNYKNGILQALSSSDAFNTDLMKIKQEKRVFNDPALGGRYEYIIATRRKMVDFLRKMQSISF